MSQTSRHGRHDREAEGQGASAVRSDSRWPWGSRKLGERRWIEPRRGVARRRVRPAPWGTGRIVGSGRRAAVCCVAVNGRGQLTRQAGQERAAAQAGLLGKVVEGIRADGAFEVGLGDGAVGALVDPRVGRLAMAALGKVVDELAQSTGDQATDASRAEAAEQAAEIADTARRCWKRCSGSGTVPWFGLQRGSTMCRGPSGVRRACRGSGSRPRPAGPAARSSRDSPCSSVFLVGWEGRTECPPAGSAAVPATVIRPGTGQVGVGKEGC